jgi:hexulose-6-phosphate isomerase
MDPQRKSTESASASSADVGRREMLAYAAAFGTAFLARQGLLEGAEPARSAEPQPALAAVPRYDMKKSINLWAFPYPDKWSLQKCLELAKDAGFDAVELNLALEGEFSAASSDAEIVEVRRLAERVGIAVSGVCSFLFWPYPLTHNDPERRRKALELATRMIDVARLVGTENLLVVPGAVYAAWVEEFSPVPNDVCEQRAREAIQRLIPVAEKAGVLLNIENIFVNGFLFSPQEMVSFVDSFQSPVVNVHFDTGNIMQYQFPEDWVPLLGTRIKNIHFKEWDKRVHEFNLNTFRPLLDGTTNWPAVMAALDKINYRGYLTFEYFHPFAHYPESLIYQTSDALDRMLGRKS